jgi:cation-transporting ATPase E
MTGTVPGPEPVPATGPQQDAPAHDDTGAGGLTSVEVRARVAAGQVNVTRDRGARPLSQIIRSNTMTIFNLVIGVMWVLMLLTAPLQDALFGFIIVINAAIGIVQEYRAARTLAKLSLVGAARPVVRRDGREVALPAAEVVRDDVIVLRAGDQIVVDGPVVRAAGLQVDESLLTGEADPVDRGPGEQVLSGSFVLAGSGAMRAERVGPASYAAGLAAQARVYTPTRSELMGSIMRFVRIMTYLLLPISAALFVSQVRASPDISDAIAGTIAGVVTMIPEGLVLLTSVAMAVAVIRLGRANALVQELPAVEVLARVDVLCIDKTGTLTEPRMALRDVRVLDPAVAVEQVLCGLGSAEEAGNPTAAAVAAAYPARAGVRVVGVVPFSSERKWSAAALAEPGAGSAQSRLRPGDPTGAGWSGWWVLGAPEVVCAADPGTCADALAQAQALAASGARILLLGEPSAEPSADRPLPSVRPVGLLVIDQALRPDAADTVAWFAREGVALKVLSGDNPRTVAAIAEQAGIEGAANPVDARTLPDDEAALGALMESTSVFGRVAPEQKRSMVAALQARGHVVAMTGDGVNDVLALKRADLGIAMGSGSGASRTVAQIVLVDNRFATMPGVVAEGRRVLGNIERVSDLFLNKSFYATALAIMTILLTVPYPFLPRHSTVINALTIGVPAFLLALMPNAQRFRPGFVRRVLSWAIPSGLVCALATMASYSVDLLAYRGDVDRGELSSADAVAEARVAAAITLFLAAWWVLVLVSRPLNALRLAIVAAMAVGFAMVLAIPALSDFLALSLGPDRDGAVAVGVGLVAMVALTVLHRFVRPRPGARWW